MEHYRRILCTTDFTDYSEAAVERAASLATQFRADLTLMHVIEHFPEERPAESVPPEHVDPETFRVNQARDRLAEQARSLGSQVRREVRISSRSAYQEIVEFAEEAGIDLIVLASHGHQGILGMLGSNVDRVLHGAPCDVLVVRAKD